MSHLVAVPSMNPGGLEAQVALHFGHCDAFTLVAVEQGAVKNVRVLPNEPHEHGACTTPVLRLAEQGVTVMLAGGMGKRPFEAFQQKGIRIYFAGEGSVDAAMQSFLRGQLTAFGDNGLCKGGCGHHEELPSL